MTNIRIMLIADAAERCETKDGDCVKFPGISIFHNSAL